LLVKSLASVASIYLFSSFVSTSLNNFLMSSSLSHPKTLKSSVIKTLGLFGRILMEITLCLFVSISYQGPLPGISLTLYKVRSGSLLDISYNTPSDLTIWWVTTLLTPLKTKTPSSVITGISVTKISCSFISPVLLLRSWTLAYTGTS